MSYADQCVKFKFPPAAKTAIPRIFATKIQITKRTVVEKIVIIVLKMDAFVRSTTFFTIN